MTTTVHGIEGFHKLVGEHIGWSDWLVIDQDRVDLFADATDDHQWIHVDRERIKKESPFGKPIAHGYFTVSLIAGMFFEMVEIKNFAMVINYGLNKVRFPTPLKEGQRYRLAMKLGTVTKIPNGVEGLLGATMEIEGEAKPACVAELVFRFYGAQG